jgi:hypothetical protein
MTIKQIEKRARARRILPPLYELAAHNVFGFCLTHGLSRSTFYALRRAGVGPRIMKCGRRTLVSVEAAAAWRRARERAALALSPGRYGTPIRTRRGRRAGRLGRVRKL